MRGHIAVCVYAAVIEALIDRALATPAGTPSTSSPGASRSNSGILAALDVDTTGWDRAHTR